MLYVLQEAMECDGDEFVLAMEEPSVPVAVVAPTTAAVKREDEEEAGAVLPPMQIDQEACDVVVGSEEWHAGIDPVSQLKMIKYVKLLVNYFIFPFSSE